MKYSAQIIAICLLGALLTACEPDVVNPPARQIFFTGEVNGTPVTWFVDDAAYKTSMAPYNSMNVSLSNNYIRYGTSIWTNVAGQYPYICVEFSGFLADVNDDLPRADFISYWHTGTYTYGTTTNQDTANVVNIVYEENNNILDVHQSADIAQPGGSSFNVDSLEIVEEPNKDAKEYIRISFNVTLHNATSAVPDIVITNGVLRVLIDNYLEL